MTWWVAPACLMAGFLAGSGSVVVAFILFARFGARFQADQQDGLYRLAYILKSRRPKEAAQYERVLQDSRSEDESPPDRPIPRPDNPMELVQVQDFEGGTMEQITLEEAKSRGLQPDQYVRLGAVAPTPTT